MRQRRIKNLEEKLEACRDYIVYDAEEYKGKWNDLFAESDVSESGGLFMELGCGKGAFILGLAKKNPNSHYIGFEVQQSVISIAGRKLLEEEQKNAKLVNCYVDDVRDIFEEGELDGIYLNFSDPWPKKKHAKRRLTHRKKLESYRDVVKPGGFLEIKTDNDGLFEFTVDELEALDYNIAAITTDLHKSEFMKDNIMTEYEEKFSILGKNIYYIRVVF